MNKKQLIGLIVMVVAGAIVTIVGCGQSGTGAASGTKVSATKKGFGDGDVKVELTLDSNKKIVDINIDASSQTPGIGQDAAPKLQEAIKKAGTIEGVDGITGATLTSDAVFEACKECLSK